MSALLVCWCVIAAAWGGIFAWRYQNFMNPDGISYLDIASNTSRTGPAALVNPHWSPLYPVLIAFWEWLHRPSPFGEFASIHALNATIYLIAAICFAYFLGQLIRFRSAADREFARASIFVAFGFALFFYFMNTDVTAFVVTPDLLVAACIFLSAGLAIRILRPPVPRHLGKYGDRVDWPTFTALGITLALGYMAKSVMLPGGIALLGILLWYRRRSKALRRGVLLATGVMFILSAPQILLISKRVGHLSFSETGRLNYLWWIDQKPFEGWTGTPGGDIPAHGPRILEEHPKIIEFASPIPGTYPLWYDPAYWYAGAKARIDWRRQLHVIKNSVRFYHIAFPRLRLPFEGLVFLSILAYVERRRLGRGELILILWPIAILSMYALLFTEWRYTAPLIVVLCVLAYSAILERIGDVERILLAGLAGVMLILSARETLKAERTVLAPGTSFSTYAVVQLPTARGISPDQIAAHELIGMGLQAGDPIATVGEAFQHFYAHIARVHVVAEVQNPAEFWRLRPEEAVSAEQRIANAGAKLLVAINRPAQFQSGLWQNIPGTGYSVLKLHN